MSYKTKFYVQSKMPIYNHNTLEKMWDILHYIIKTTDFNPKNILLLGLYGSQNYRLDVASSDIDCECLVFPSLEDIIFGNKPYVKCIETPFGLCQIKDVRQAMNELRKSSPNMIEVFASSYLLINSNYYDHLNIMNDFVSVIAGINPYRFVRGLEGLLDKYCKDLSNPKNFVNAKRVLLTMQHYMKDPDGFNGYALIPKDYSALVPVREYFSTIILSDSFLSKITSFKNSELAKWKKQHPDSIQETNLQQLNMLQINLMDQYLSEIYS